MLLVPIFPCQKEYSEKCNILEKNNKDYQGNIVQEVTKQTRTLQLGKEVTGRRAHGINAYNQESNMESR